MAIVGGAALLFLAPAQADSRHSPEGGETDIVQYECDNGENIEIIRVRVEMTMPTNAQPGTQMTIGWRGTYTDGTQLTAPADGLSGANLYAYASISGLAGLTSATGTIPLSGTSIAANQPIPLPTGTVELKTTANTSGTATVKPGAINIGTQPTNPLIECEVLNPDNLRGYSLTIGGQGGNSSSPTPTNTTSNPASTASPTVTVTTTTTTTATATETIESGTDGKVARTPAGSAATGGGGDAGPDARLITLTGLALMLAGGTGLAWRHRRLRRG